MELTASGKSSVPGNKEIKSTVIFNRTDLTACDCVCAWISYTNTHQLLISVEILCYYIRKLQNINADGGIPERYRHKLHTYRVVQTKTKLYTTEILLTFPI